MEKKKSFPLFAPSFCINPHFKSVYGCHLAYESVFILINTTSAFHSMWRLSINVPHYAKFISLMFSDDMRL